jgi:signal transduction histidine kinase
VVVVLADDGPGIPLEKRNEALRRGGRLDSAGPGAGVGLAIVTDIAEAWRRTLWFDTPGSWLCVCLRIPIAI